MFTIKIEWLFTRCAVIFTNKSWWTCKLVTFTTKPEVVSVARVSLPFVSAPHLVVFTVILVHTHCKTFELYFRHLSCMCGQHLNIEVSWEASFCWISLSSRRPINQYYGKKLAKSIEKLPFHIINFRRPSYLGVCVPNRSWNPLPDRSSE